MSITPENSELIAINALQFLASDRTFLAGVLDHLLADESMLLVFCESSGIAPELPARARFALDHRGLTGADV